MRLDEARALLSAGHFSGSYYLGGYAVECALKACITKNILAEELPPRKFGDQVYTHELASLLKLAGLDSGQPLAGDATLEVNWATVKDWSEHSRYLEATEIEARELITAIDDASHGVLAWLIQHW
jgi:HEPN domain-containing protein